MKVPWSKRYAHDTTVSVEKTRAEIESTLRRFGATKIASAIDTEARRAEIHFEFASRRIRFAIPPPETTLAPYTRDILGWATAVWPASRLDAEEKRLWRSLLMAIKAKLEIVASGISSFEVEFLAYTMLDGRRTFADAAQQPDFVAALESGHLPPMLNA